MPDDLPKDKPVTENPDTTWLHQFYTVSKSTHDSEFAESGAAQPQPPPPLAVTPAEKYRIGDELGSGGMKSVLRTRDRNTGRDVAMAMLRDPAEQARKMNRFVREARVTAALEHPNIVPIYDMGLDSEGKPYFTMKLLGGETLHIILQRVNGRYGNYRAQYPLGRLLRIFTSVCDAVSFAHSRGVIHLDIKPANIQVGDFGEVLVLDWGLAKVLEKNPAFFPNRLVLEKSLREIPSEGVVRGTPGFMSPEQSRGEYASLDERADIFAMGALLSVILNCRKGSEKPPAGLEAVAAKAMSDLPEHRYQSVQELARDVSAYLEGYATKAQQAGLITQILLLVKRHNVVAALAFIFFLTVNAVVAYAFMRIRHSEQVAIEALANIKAEQASKHEIAIVAAPRLLQEAQDMIRNLDYDKAISTLERAVALDSSLTDAWWNLGAIRLGRQELDMAAAAFKHVPKPDISLKGDRPVDMQGMVEKYTRLVAREGRTALEKHKDDFVNDIIHCDHNPGPLRDLAVALFFQKYNRNPQTVDYGTIDKALRGMNPTEVDLVFIHENTPDGLKITLHGAELNRINPLIGLPVSVLDATRTGSLDLEWLRGAPLVFVDLSGSKTWDLRQLDPYPSLREVRLLNWQNKTKEKDYGGLANNVQLKRFVVDEADVPLVRKVLQNTANARSQMEIVGE
jgi:tRNA A-37 threonylcarbamoyl transferase component Bud32/cytochrome c-type biogenesis protein CcmH/NrfG